MKTKNLSPFDLRQVNIHLEELDRIASAAGGINAVLDAIVEANEAKSDWPLRDNTRVQRALCDSLEILISSAATATQSIRLLIEH